MSDRIVLHEMVFQARHGYYDHEQVTPQRFEVDVELNFDLRPAGLDDDLAKTVDYAAVYAATRQIVESTTFRLLEALAEAIGHEILAEFPIVDNVLIRVRKPEVSVGGPLAYAGVEIRRQR